MVSRKLMGVWAFLDFCLLLSGALAVAFSIIWRKPDVLTNMIISGADLTAGLALGICLLITFVVSIGAVVQRNHITMGFVILNWLLLGDALGIVVIGSFVWFYTLKERDNFHIEWLKLSPASRITLQDQFSCCGYQFGNDTAEIGGTYCISQQFIDGLDAKTEKNFCISAITNHADVSLNNIFTVVYGFMAVAIALFLTSMCVIKKRQEDERFKKIDAKRGGRGFV